MNKHTAKFEAARTLANANRLVSYMRAHSMAECFATPEQLALIDEARKMVEDARAVNELLDDPNYVGSRHHY